MQLPTTMPAIVRYTQRTLILPVLQVNRAHRWLRREGARYEVCWGKLLRERRGRSEGGGEEESSKGEGRGELHLVMVEIETENKMRGLWEAELWVFVKE